MKGEAAFAVRVLVAERSWEGDRGLARRIYSRSSAFVSHLSGSCLRPVQTRGTQNETLDLPREGVEE